MFHEASKVKRTGRGYVHRFQTSPDPYGNECRPIKVESAGEPVYKNKNFHSSPTVRTAYGILFASVCNG